MGTENPWLVLATSMRAYETKTPTEPAPDIAPDFHL